MEIDDIINQLIEESKQQINKNIWKDIINN